MWDIGWASHQEEQRLVMLDGPVPLVLDVPALHGVRRENADDDVARREPLVDLIRPVGADRDVVLVHPGAHTGSSQMGTHLPGKVAVGALIRDEYQLAAGRHVAGANRCSISVTRVSVGCAPSGSQIER